MTKIKTFVVTQPGLGWDSVVGVYQAKSEKKLLEYLLNQDEGDINCIGYSEEEHVITEMNLQIIK